MAEYISMKQVPGGTVTAVDDRILYDVNLNSGVIYGCDISYQGNNMIHINAGYGVIKGGLFEMEDHTEYVEYAEDEPTTGQIYLKFDAAAVDKLVIVSETTNNLHPLEQDEDANYDSGVYEIQLCTFTATTTALTDVTQTFSIAEGSVDVLDSLTDIMANTDSGKAAGALAVKELNTNLTAKLPTDIEGFSVTDGSAYITYKVGADSVTKKLGSDNSGGRIALFTIGGISSNIERTIISNGYSTSENTNSLEFISRTRNNYCFYSIYCPFLDDYQNYACSYAERKDGSGQLSYTIGVSNAPTTFISTNGTIPQGCKYLNIKVWNQADNNYSVYLTVYGVAISNPR